MALMVENKKLDDLNERVDEKIIQSSIIWGILRKKTFESWV